MTISSESKPIDDMSEEELINYITELLTSNNYKKYIYEEFSDKNITITKTQFKTKTGLEIIKEDRWEN